MCILVQVQNEKTNSKAKEQKEKVSRKIIVEAVANA